MRSYTNRLRRLEQRFKPGCTCGGPGLVIVLENEQIPPGKECRAHPGLDNRQVVRIKTSLYEYEYEDDAREEPQQCVVVNLPPPAVQFDA
jgi:hypothetical protein